MKTGKYYNASNRPTDPFSTFVALSHIQILSVRDIHEATTSILDNHKVFRKVITNIFKCMAYLINPASTSKTF